VVPGVRKFNKAPRKQQESRKNSSHLSTHTFKRGNLVNITIAIRHRTQPHPSSLQKLQQLQGAREKQGVHIMPVCFFNASE
jgi:hypothetical protein